MNALPDSDLATLRKVLAHFLLCREVSSKYAVAFQDQAKELAGRIEAEVERRSHMARHQRPTR